MVLMPHIKAIIQDILTMTSNIVVKYEDLAVQNEKNPETVNLMLKYKNIMDGIPNDYTSIPIEVLSNMCVWKSIDPISVLSQYGKEIDLLVPKKYYIDGKNITISLNALDPDTPANEGDYYIIPYSTIGDLKYHKVDIKSVITRESYLKLNMEGLLYNLYEYGEKSGWITVYLNDFSKGNTKIRISMRLVAEYVEPTDTFEDAKYSIESPNPRDDSNIIQSPTSDGQDHDTYISDAYYRYDEKYRDGSTVFDEMHGVTVQYVNDNGIYRIKFDSDDGSETYIKKLTLEYSISGEDTNDEYKMFKIGSTTIPSYYTEYEKDSLGNGIVYYEPNPDSGLVTYITAEDYDLLTDEEKSKYNNTIGYYNYRCDNIYAIDINEIYIDDDGNETYRYELNDDLSPVLYLDKSSTEPIIVNGYDAEENSRNQYVYIVDGVTHIDDEPPYPMYMKTATGKYVKTSKYIDGNTYCISTPTAVGYRYDKRFTDSEARYYSNNYKELDLNLVSLIISATDKYYADKYCPEEYRNNLKYSIPIYTGETNLYYRTLNGLPPINETDLPIVDRSLFETNYTERYVMASYLYDYEVEAIENNGMLDELKTRYPNADYLNYIGLNRIDVVKARLAGFFDILRHGQYINENVYKMFMESYGESKQYVFSRHFVNSPFSRHEYFTSFIAFLILTNAINIVMAKSGNLIEFNQYEDYESAQLKLLEYGFNTSFGSIPLIYRIKLSKYMGDLIRNKGTDNIYDTIKTIFDVDYVDVYEYFIKKYKKNGEDTLEFVEVPLNSPNLYRDLQTANTYDFDLFVKDDPYWNISAEELKTKEFNLILSKYISLVANFDVDDISRKYSALLNYFFDNSTSKYRLYVTPFDGTHTLKNLVISLYYIQSLISKRDTLIPCDIVKGERVKKFNITEPQLNQLVKQELLNSDIHRDERKNAVLNNQYRENIDYVNDLVDYITNGNNTLFTPSDKTDIKAIATAYLKNLDKNAVATYSLTPRLPSDTDEDYRRKNNPLFKNSLSFYAYVKEIAKNTNDIKSKICMDRILSLIGEGTTSETDFEMSSFKWEKIIKYKMSSTGQVGGNPELDYYNIPNNKIFTKVDPSNDDRVTQIVKTLKDIFYTSQGYLNDYIKINPSKLYHENANDNHICAVELNGFSLNDVGLPTNAKLPTTSFDAEKFISFVRDGYITLYSTKNLVDSTYFDNSMLNSFRVYKVFNDAELAISSKPLSEFEQSRSSLYEYSNVSYYAEVKADGNNDYDVTVYKRTMSALSYGMYLRETDPEIYSTISSSNISETDKTTLIKLMASILESLYSNISSLNKGKELNLTYVDYESIIEYMKLVIDTFKSYSIDLWKSSTSYRFNNNYIKIMDELNFKQSETFENSMKILDRVDLRHKDVALDSISIRDEIIFS